MKITPEKSEETVKDFQHLEIIQECFVSQKSNLIKQGIKEGMESEKLYICHVTSYFPENGIIYPRATFNLPEMHNLSTEMAAVATRALSIPRPTVHFAINSIAESHTSHSGFSETPFIIIEKLQEGASQIRGGYIEDLFCIGKFRLSSNAILLLHTSYQSNTAIQDKIKSIPKGIKVIYYAGSPSIALRNFLESQHSAYLTLAPVKNREEPMFFGTIQNKMVSSLNIIKQINGVLCTHDVTPMAQIEGCFEGLIPQYPYLYPLRSLSIDESVSLIKRYVSAMRNSFNVDSDTYRFIASYENALIHLIYLFKDPASASSDNLTGSQWDYYKDLICSYDYKPDLDRAIDQTTSTTKLSDMTGLFFKPYYRSGSTTIVDAVYIRDGNEEKENVTKKLSSYPQLLFKNEICKQKLEDKECIVLAGVNIKETQDEIAKAYGAGTLLKQ
ncbi:hypothetical protein [Legionella feeleii]|uniref:Uncharacterized protein n=1 Tax=Legionella feeleii TaxID=453 RepID=A0A378IZ50_9GAMM|nr:hypothetical protein [Legionella feeleii]STX37314.1 Uncharacterised protein [Legionella feeleii]